MLAARLALFCLRYIVPKQRWSGREAKMSFWSLNIGLAWMVFATLSRSVSFSFITPSASAASMRVL